MQPHNIPQIANHLLKKHGLIQKGWTFAWDHARRRCGSCQHRTKRITLSKSYVALNVAANLDEIIDTILHEIAHALTGPGHGHNDTWKAMCVQVGARPKRCADTGVILMPGRMVAKCPSCGKEYRRHRVRLDVGRYYYCPPCRKEKGILTFKDTTAAPTVVVNQTEDTPPQPRRLRG